MTAFRQLRSSTTNLFSKILSRPRIAAFILFLFIYAVLVHYCSYAYYRDPTSAFFDPNRGYERRYSLKRQHDAEEFVRKAGSSPIPASKHKIPKMCVGIATVARDKEQYVRSTLGSILDGLAPNEREEIHLGVLIAHTDPDLHPIYSDQWLTKVVDKVYLYDVDHERFKGLKEWEENNQYRWKAVFDYTYILQKCVNTGAQWIAIIEDDTLAVAGWYPRAIEAVDKADERHWGGKSDWLYLRLFFTEEFLGWNNEEWPWYLAASVGITGMNAIVLLLMRHSKFDKGITNRFIAVICLICTPACIALYFLAGRLSMQPFSPGVYEMPKFGCCGQGYIFSREMAPKIIDRLSQKRLGFVDEMIDELAHDTALSKLVIMPSLLQHIGTKTSKEDDFGNTKSRNTVAEKIWNFGFEMYDTGLTH